MGYNFMLLNKEKPKKTTNTAKNELINIENSNNPWWFQTPYILKIFIDLTILPVKIINIISDLIVNIGIIIIAWYVYQWWKGNIPNEIIYSFINEFGKKIIDIIKNSGII